jgi:flagellar motor protein MotB
VNLAGHADSTPIHNHRFRNNWELAAARSLRLMEVLTERDEIAESRVSISSTARRSLKAPTIPPTAVPAIAESRS